jgi:general secretion pathway protein J
MTDVRGAFLSAHVNPNPMYIATLTAFVGRHQSPGDRVDFTAFTHRRLMRGVHEGDAAEVGYRVEPRTGTNGTSNDLVRRESPRIDADPLRGGTIDVLVPDVVSFTVRYYDRTQDQWLDTWDTTQAAGQAGRLPSRVRAVLVLRDPDGIERRYMTESAPMITEVLRFGLPIDYH